MPKPRNKKNKAKKKSTATEPSLLLPNGGLVVYPEIPTNNTPSPATSSQQQQTPWAEGQDTNNNNHNNNNNIEADDNLEGPSCIEKRWNGPRVLDVEAFVMSRHATAPSVEDASCAVYAAPEAREMILKVLPQDNALILWYNKSRKSARICPACRRFYTLGDILLPHLIDDQSGSRAEYVDPRNLREKRISGLCSLMCFGIASYNWPGSIGAWGKSASEIDAMTRAILLGPGANIADDGMGAFMKITRVENLLEAISGVSSAGHRLY